MAEFKYDSMFELNISADSLGLTFLIPSSNIALSMLACFINSIRFFFHQVHSYWMGLVQWTVNTESQTYYLPSSCYSYLLCHQAPYGFQPEMFNPNFVADVVYLLMPFSFFIEYLLT